MVSSACNKGWYSASESEKKAPTSLDYRKRWNYYRLNGNRCGYFSKIIWDEMMPFEKNCWYWYYVNNRINNDLSKIPKHRWIRIKLEYLDNKLETLCEFLGVDYYAIDIPHINKAKTPPRKWSEWSSKEMELFTKWCGKLMDTIYPNWNAL
jgi:hypothetical protein